MTLMETMELPRKDFIAGTVAGAAMLAAHWVLAKSAHRVHRRGAGGAAGEVKDKRRWGRPLRGGFAAPCGFCYNMRRKVKLTYVAN